MRRDLFDLCGATPRELWWRVVFLAVILFVVLMDMLVWRPN